MVCVAVVNLPMTCGTIGVAFLGQLAPDCHGLACQPRGCPIRHPSRHALSSEHCVLQVICCIATVRHRVAPSFFVIVTAVFRLRYWASQGTNPRKNYQRVLNSCSPFVARVQCPFNVHSMPVRCPFSVHSMSIHCPFNVHSMSIQCPFNFH